MKPAGTQIPDAEVRCENRSGGTAIVNETAPYRGHFEYDPIPYAFETDWPVGAGGLEPPHQESCAIGPTAIVRRKKWQQIVSPDSQQARALSALFARHHSSEASGNTNS